MIDVTNVVELVQVQAALCIANVLDVFFHAPVRKFHDCRTAQRAQRAHESVIARPGVVHTRLRIQNTSQSL